MTPELKAILDRLSTLENKNATLEQLFYNHRHKKFDRTPALDPDSGGGPIIRDSLGNDYPQRKFLKFAGNLIFSIGDTPPDETEIDVSMGLNRYVFIPAEAMNPTTTDGCAALVKTEAASNDVDYWTLDFDDTTEEHAFFTLSMPTNWDFAQNFSSVTLFWTAAAGTHGDGVVWGIKGRVFTHHDAIDQAYGSEVLVTDTLDATGELHDPSNGPIVVAGTPANSPQWFQFKVSRKVGNAGDTLAHDARLMGIMIGYIIDPLI